MAWNDSGSMDGRIGVRNYVDGDAVPLSELFAIYMREAYGEPNAMSAEVLRDTVGRHFDIVLAVDSDERLIGFAAWRESYDLHNAVSGGEIPDLYVRPEYRGRLVAIRLISAVGSAVLARGGKFIRAEVLAGAPSRLARRMAVGFPSETVYLAGRGLREFVALGEADARAIVGGLPSPEASRDP